MQIRENVTIPFHLILRKFALIFRIKGKWIISPGEERGRDVTDVEFNGFSDDNKRGRESVDEQAYFRLKNRKV